MSDPGLALQAAIVAVVTADATLSGLIGGRIHDEVPDDVAFPFVSFGEGQVVEDAFGDCGSTFDVYQTLDVWSRAQGRVEAAAIADALRRAFVAAPPAPVGFDLVEITHTSTQVFRDPDGRTTHAVVAFRAALDPAA